MIVKVETSLDKHERELAVLRFASKAAVPVPAVICAVPESPSLLVLERLDGVPLCPTDGPT